MRFLALVTVVGLVVGSVGAGTLQLGPPVVSNNQYRFPVYLQGDAEGVAALDFRLAYDPAVFSPVSAQSGPSAASAQKQVSSNVASPGEFVVVMMGFNQNSVAPGQVVEIVMEKLTEPSNGQSILRIAEPTMATIDGNEIDSRGLTRTVEFGHPKGEDDKTPETPEQDETADESPETPKAEEALPETPRATRGTVPFIIAGRGGEGGGIAGRMPAPAGTPALPPAVQPRAPVEKGGPTAAPSPAILPNGAGNAESDSPAAPGGAPSPDAQEPGGAVGPVNSALPVAQQEAEASIVAPETHEVSPPLSGSKEGKRRIFGILLIFGLAPAALFMVYKVMVR